MGRYNNIDLGLTQDGDIDVSNGDLAIVRDSAIIDEYNVPTRKALATSLKRDILKRLATDPGDYFQANLLSANLQRFKSQKVTPYLVSRMEEAVIRSLTIDGRVSPEDLDVVCLPINKQTVILFVFVQIEGERINLTPGLSFDMSDGITLPS